jgi:ubiquinone/menaquinone biosynthesis C-methylase UbiE
LKEKNLIIKFPEVEQMDWHVRKFHLIAPFYQLFFDFQVRFYTEIIQKNMDRTYLKKKDRVLDIGSGTGAFAKSWQLAGLEVLASDRAPGMIRRCRKNGMECMELDILKKMPFRDKAFQAVTAAYVAHGLGRQERQFLYRESARVSDKIVILHDLNQRQNWLVSTIEAIEQSHYRDFVRSVSEEMLPFFRDVKVLPINRWNNWYLCFP